MSAQVLRFSDYERRAPTWPRQPDQEDIVLILPMIRFERYEDDPSTRGLKKLKPKR